MIKLKTVSLTDPGGQCSLGPISFIFMQVSCKWNWAMHDSWIVVVGSISQSKWRHRSIGLSTGKQEAWGTEDIGHLRRDGGIGGGVGYKKEHSEEFKCERNEDHHFATNTYTSQQVEFFYPFVSSCPQQILNEEVRFSDGLTYVSSGWSKNLANLYGGAPSWRVGAPSYEESLIRPWFPLDRHV